MDIILPAHKMQGLLDHMATRLQVPKENLYYLASEFYGDEAWHDIAKCVNCNAGAAVYDFHIDYTDAMTMIKLGEQVRHRLDTGLSFTEANKIHISGLQGILTSTQIDRKTQLKYLGLIAKYKEDGKQKDSLWVITTWGYAFLRGETVFKTARVYRKEIVERLGAIDLSEALATKSSLTETGWDLACFNKYNP